MKILNYRALFKIKVIKSLTNAKQPRLVQKRRNETDVE